MLDAFPCEDALAINAIILRETLDNDGRELGKVADAHQVIVARQASGVLKGRVLKSEFAGFLGHFSSEGFLGPRHTLGDHDTGVITRLDDNSA